MMKREYKYHLLIPKILVQWLDDIEQNPPKIVGFKRSRMEYIISTILKHKQDKHPGAYSLLNMTYLKNIVPNADKYLNILKDHNIVEWKNYCAGRNSRMYRIKKLYDGPVIYRTLTDQNLYRRIERNRSDLKLRNSKKYKQLNKYVYSVTIYKDAALHTIEEAYRSNMKVNKPKAEARRTFSLAEISKIESGEIYIKVNSTNGRYDSNYTRLPSELVKHLCIDGKPLTEMDIVNSQPFFAVSLFNPTPDIAKIITKQFGGKFTMYVRNLHLMEYEDIKLYRLLVVNGEFYEYMMSKFKENGIEYADRADFKEQLFTVFFGKNSAIHYSKSVKLFSSLFPNVYKLFAAIKEHEHNKLAILLQRIESFAMLDCVAQRILVELPDVKFITKHDSLLPAGVMVTCQVEEVEKLISEGIEEAIGVRPRLKLKGATPYSEYKSLSFQSPLSSMYAKSL